MDFTEWLTQEMQKRGWSQAELARESGITKGALSHIFSGTRKPGVIMLKAIAQAFYLPAEHVFRIAGLLETDDPPSDSDKISDLDEWIRIFVEADAETRQQLLDGAHSVVGKPANPRKKA